VVVLLVACSSPFPCLAASHHPLDLPQKSRKSSAMNTYKKCVCNPFRMNTCKTWDLKYLCFQHLQKKGRGWVIMVNQHPAKGAGPERPTGAEGPLQTSDEGHLLAPSAFCERARAVVFASERGASFPPSTLSISSASLAIDCRFTPNSFRKGLPLSLSLQTTKIISLRFNRLRTLSCPEGLP
jgi:hypothetical protein